MSDLQERPVERMGASHWTDCSMKRYEGTHHYQYAAGNSARTRSSGCTWISGAVGADYATGGKTDPSPDRVLSMVKVSEETSPQTPGWSLADLARAMQRLGVPFAVRAGQGWAGVRAARKANLAIVLQGDSDRFPNSSCSGDFDGDHAILLPPDTAPDGRWAYHDSICREKEYTSEATLRAYAEKFAPGVAFGVFTTPVPPALPDTSTEDAMKLTNVVPLSGTAIITAEQGYALWVVATETRTKVLAKGTRFEVLGSCRYRPNEEVPKGYPGYIVPYGSNGELHVLPAGQEGQLASFYAEWTTTQAYNAAIDDAAKASAKGGAEAVLALKR